MTSYDQPSNVLESWAHMQIPTALTGCHHELLRSADTLSGILDLTFSGSISHCPTGDTPCPAPARPGNVRSVQAIDSPVVRCPSGQSSPSIMSAEQDLVAPCHIAYEVSALLPASPPTRTIFLRLSPCSWIGSRRWPTR